MLHSFWRCKRVPLSTLPSLFGSQGELLAARVCCLPHVLCFLQCCLRSELLLCVHLPSSICICRHGFRLRWHIHHQLLVVGQLQDCHSWFLYHWNRFFYCLFEDIIIEKLFCSSRWLIFLVHHDRIPRNFAVLHLRFIPLASCFLLQLDKHLLYSWNPKKCKNHPIRLFHNISDIISFMVLKLNPHPIKIKLESCRPNLVSCWKQPISVVTPRRGQTCHCVERERRSMASCFLCWPQTNNPGIPNGPPSHVARFPPDVRAGPA